MNVQRESKSLRMRSGHVSAPMRTVIGYQKVRRYLDDQLARAEAELNIDATRVKAMPYALVVGDGESQKILPIVVNRNFYQRTRDTVEKVDPAAEFGTLTPNKVQVAYIESLREYDLAGNGILVDGVPQGIIFSQLCECRGDITLPVVGEHFGPYTSDKSSLHVAGDARNCYEGRGRLERRVQNMISDANLKQIVTLGPSNDIVGILKGNYKFQEGDWALRH